MRAGAATRVVRPEPLPGGEEGRPTAQAVIEGCRVREQTPANVEFTVRADRFAAAEELGFVPAGDAASFRAAVATFAGGKRDGAPRSRFVERYRLSSQEWEVEAEARLWGRADRLFAADARHAPDQVGDLQMKRLCRPNVTLTFRSGPKPSHAVGEIEAPRYTWENASSPCAEYLGLHFRGFGRFSEFIDTMVRDGAKVASEAVTVEGRDGVRLELRWATGKGAWHVLKLGFVRLDGYAPFSAERLSVIRREGEPETLVRTAAEWGDFAQVPAGPWIPCSYRYASYSTGERGALTLTTASIVRVDRNRIAAAEGRLSDEELSRWFPLGTFVAAPPIAKQELGPDVVDAMTRDNAGASTSEACMGSPLEKLVPWMDDPLFTAAPEGRKRLAGQLREETKRAAQERK